MKIEQKSNKNRTKIDRKLSENQATIKQNQTKIKQKSNENRAKSERK